MQNLFNAINSIMPVNEDEMQQIAASFQPLTVPKKQYWIKEGAYCNHIAFVLSGKLRMFYMDGNANEITCFFVAGGGFITSFGGFLTHTPARESIIAVEDTELLVIHRDALEAVSDAIPRLHILRRIIAENLFLFLEDRIRMMQSLSAEERYEKFMNESPELLLDIPLQQTASFLGITPQHLSRLRKNKMK